MTLQNVHFFILIIAFSLYRCLELHHDTLSNLSFVSLTEAVEQEENLRLDKGYERARGTIVEHEK